MIPLNRTNNDIFPLELKIELENGWKIIWENGLQVMIGKGYYRKYWDYEEHRFFKCPNDNQKMEGKKNERRWF